MFGSPRSEQFLHGHMFDSPHSEEFLHGCMFGSPHSEVLACCMFGSLPFQLPQHQVASRCAAMCGIMGYRPGNGLALGSGGGLQKSWLFLPGGSTRSCQAEGSQGWWLAGMMAYRLGSMQA